MRVSIINFLSGDRKMCLKCYVDLPQALYDLQHEYGDVKIHSVHPVKGPIIIFKYTPHAHDVTKWCIYQECLIVENEHVKSSNSTEGFCFSTIQVHQEALSSCA